MSILRLSLLVLAFVTMGCWDDLPEAPKPPDTANVDRGPILIQGLPGCAVYFVWTHRFGPVGGPPKWYDNQDYITVIKCDGKSSVTQDHTCGKFCTDKVTFVE
jgi:hypothetical protein